MADKPTVTINDPALGDPAWRDREAATVALVLECPRRAGPVDHDCGYLIHGYTKYRPGVLACFMAEVFDEPGTVYRVGFYPSEAQAKLNEAKSRGVSVEEARRLAEEMRGG